MKLDEAISLLCGLHDYHNEEAHELESAKTVMEKLAYAQEKERVKALDVAINAVEKAEKYRWHDLRKNPDDMPEEDVKVLTVHRYHHFSIGEDANEYEIGHRYRDTFFFSGGEGVNSKVLAWKYIEPFEGDSE